ncbi:MAG TPA: aminodeoxychorismate synthase component I [Gemmataceae bacterium]|nr:aminodeoxychorismate synthase component I [Gemmataceae bacterium]
MRNPPREAEPIRPLVEELTPAPDPWEAFQRISCLPYALFFDSADRRSGLGRCSFLTANPFFRLGATGRQVWDNEVGPREGDPFSALHDCLNHWRTETVRGLPPFQGGAAGLFGYDLGHFIERLPQPRRDDFRTPAMELGFYDWVVAFDHGERRAWIISTGLPATDPARRRSNAWDKIKILRRILARPAAPLPREQRQTDALAPALGFPVRGFPGVSSNFTRDGYLEAVRRVVQYIHAGDCYQVNLSQRLLHLADVHPVELYRRLREVNPAPFAGYFKMDDFVIVSASPERFLHVENGEVETRPIKGTRPRGVTPEEDRRQIDDLLRSAKDRAENIMIVDLLRNDLGRVCSYGSIDVPAVCRLETFEYVHHLVSEVRGRLRPGLTAVDLLRAAFPGGSVTGAPKVRAMEIIAELEPTARGPYCGSLGYIGFNGAMDTNILIRTFTVGRGWMQFPVGGGIVADSGPEDEYAETLHKAEGLLRALRA